MGAVRLSDRFQQGLSEQSGSPRHGPSDTAGATGTAWNHYRL